MGKKGKVGKQRKDKYYHLAKEAGYRSRAAFKLIQLNKRFEFLQNSRALVDLCAAPGGWLQVASQNMPVSSLCIGIDLAPIKAINNCITLQGDITTEASRVAIKKELNRWEADCVLHDGAPNVGLNWAHDAFQQNCLTLSALKLATQILRKNGYFVTKVFRSNDYHALIGVFEKLFRRVHVWKPAASRLESAEIFVVCEKYLKPAKVDPNLLDSKKVFVEPDVEPSTAKGHNLLRPPKKQKKEKAEGYLTDSLIVYKELPASQFIENNDPLTMLSEANCIVLDLDRYKKSPKTTTEVLECMKDIKVCGPRELRLLLKWRQHIIKEVKEEQKMLNPDEDKDAEPVEEDPDEVEDREMAEIDEMIRNASAAEKAALKKKKRQLLKDKAKFMEKKKLGMIHEGDKADITDDINLFSLARIKRAKLRALEKAGEGLPDVDDDEDHDIEAQYASGDEDEDPNDEGTWESRGRDEDDDDHDDDSDNELVHTEETGMSKTERLESRADKWFSRNDVAELLDDDEDDEDGMDIIEKHMNRTMNKEKFHANTVEFKSEPKSKKEKKAAEAAAKKVAGSGKKASEEDVDTDTDSDDDSDVEADGFNEETKVWRTDEKFDTDDGRTAKRKSETDSGPAEKITRLTPQEKAMGEMLIYSSKTRRDLEDFGWNRYANNDDGLPDWFVKDEARHYRKVMPVTKAQVQRYREEMKELNARPVKKVAEAKARKAKKAANRLERAKKKAENILANENMEHGEKIREMKKLYKKAGQSDKKDVTYRVMTKGGRGRQQRPKGPYKVVDARLKKDNRKQKESNRKAQWKKKSTSAKRATLEQQKKRKRAARQGTD